MIKRARGREKGERDGIGETDGERKTDWEKRIAGENGGVGRCMY